MLKLIKQRRICYLCGNVDINRLPGSVRDNENLQVLECAKCGLVFLSSFDHIKEGFYEDSGMHSGEVGIKQWMIETEFDDDRRFQFVKKIIENKAVLDFGCGNGGFLAKAGEIAAVAHGLEPERKYRAHFKALGLDVSRTIPELKESFDVITMFHVLEHLPDPLSILRTIKGILKTGGRIIVEVPNSGDALLRLYRSKPFSEFTYWSCHLYLYNSSTLRELGLQAGYSVDYVKHVQRYPLSNHLYWLAFGRPGGHKNFAFIDSPELHSAYEKQLGGIGATDTIIASFLVK